jgi:hypothetical protein
MFKYAVQILPALSASDSPVWKTIYEGSLAEIKCAMNDALRELDWVTMQPRQYGDPVGVRAVVDGCVVECKSLWTS